ncbi:alpha/beta hydrolase [Halomonas sp. 18H]|uniref:alpha/beta fold hydrolase n=1 Tax=Halomonas almeriensis TaxID=308163 RepID=UPI0022302858|nr:MULTISPECIES: alpha/beta hydrolase [Halomonas]MCW4149377.1 alpha/beta hydrolase [Halomonas sp. 18H]MDN3553677.1 alpha/beta hydrolase [Halomonas almeriensis]
MSDAIPLSLASHRLAALSWGDAAAPTWLALHGWLDNAASFSRLAPYLVEQLGIRVVALDFAGHGHSRHRAGDGDYALWDYCHDVLDALDALGLDSAPLLAHSMGAGVACLLAAGLPERIAGLRLIDGLGALSTPPSGVAEQLRKGLLAARRPSSPSPCYADLDSAVQSRVRGSVTPIDAETARPLVKRNLEALSTGGWQLRSDPRLRWPSPVRFTSEQVSAMLEAICCEVLLVEGKDGILAQREQAARARAAVQGLTRCVLPGGHHLHLQAERVPAVAEAIVAHQLAAEGR